MFADLHTFGPCMLKLCVMHMSAFLEPSATGGATAEFAGLSNAAFEAPVAAANRANTRRDGCFCGNVIAQISQNELKAIYDLPLVYAIDPISNKLLLPQKACMMSCKISGSRTQHSLNMYAAKLILSTTYFHKLELHQPMYRQCLGH